MFFKGNFSARSSTVGDFYNLWVGFKGVRKIQFWLVCILTVFAALSELMGIGALIPFLGAITSPEKIYANDNLRFLFDFLGLTDSSQVLLPMTLAFIFISIFSGIVRLCLLWSQTKFSHAVGADLSIEIYRTTLYQPYTKHISQNSSDVVAAIINKANRVVYEIVHPALTILSSVIILLTLFIGLIFINPKVAIYSLLGFAIIYVAVAIVSRDRVRRYSKLVSTKQNKVLKSVQEGLGGIRDILIDRQQEAYCKEFQAEDVPLRKAIASIHVIANSPRYAVESMGMVLIALLTYQLVGTGEDVTDAIPILGALALAAQRMLPAAQLLYWGWTTIQGGYASLRDTLKIINQPISLGLSKHVQLPLKFDDNVELKDVWFRYTDTGPWILKGVDLDILKSQKIGFLGETGQGKSTLIDIFMGLLAPTKGEMTVDSICLADSNTGAWQKHITHVPQSIYLLDASIAKNIAFGIEDDGIDMDRVRAVSIVAQLNDTVESWPDGYFSRVGERGVSLSGGQRQRIGIARALYRQASVLIFDEATSALDSKTESLVINAIMDIPGRPTIIIISHRESTLANCDMVYEVKNGVVIERSLSGLN
jgi:ABC-type multidrug transport system fused ATPase/permease subunit